MPLKKITLRVNPEYESQRLDQVLAVLLPPILKQPLSKANIRKLIIAGAVYLNKKRVRIASKELRTNAAIDVYIDLQKLGTSTVLQEIPFEMSAGRILFEDEYLIAVDKPPGLPTQPTLDEARDNLFAAVKKFLSKREGCASGQVYLGMHHRLDRDTSGVIVFTKKVEANPGMADLFSTHRLEKVYQAIASSGSQKKEIPDSWVIKNYLGASSEKGKKTKFCAVRSGGKLAETAFTLRGRLKNSYWIEACPRTGRTHQIRVHLSEFGLPILGDETYGGVSQQSGVRVKRVMLHAFSLSFEHPIHGKYLSIQCPLPKDFSACLGSLSS